MTMCKLCGNSKDYPKETMVLWARIFKHPVWICKMHDRKLLRDLDYLHKVMTEYREGF